MNISKLDLLTGLISLFAFTACQKSNDIGLKTAAQSAASGFATSALTVTTQTVLDADAILTNTLSKYPYGILNDPLLGKTTANLLMSLNLPSANVDFGTNPVLESAVLVLNYANEYQGDPNAIFEFEVHQLNDRIVSTSDQKNTTTAGAAITIIGSATNTIRIDDKVSVTPVVNGAYGTPQLQAPQIRIPIDVGFINANFFNAGASNLASNDAFNNWIKGFYLKAVAASGSAVGGIVFFNLGASADSKLELCYKNDASPTAINYIAFPIKNSLNPVVAAFNHDFTGSEARTQLDNPGTAYNYTFVQPMAGLRTQVNIPDLTPLTSLGNIVINKAELEITPQGGKVDVPFAPAPRIYFYKTDASGNRQFVQDASSLDRRSLSDANFGGFYKTDGDQKYRFIITSYIQDLVNNKEQQYNAYITVADPTTTRSMLSPASDAKFSSGITARRVVIGSGSTIDPLYKMKLNITYNKVD